MRCTARARMRWRARASATRHSFHWRVLSRLRLGPSATIHETDTPGVVAPAHNEPDDLAALVDRMHVEDTHWFKLSVGAISLGAVWWLSALVGMWPHGPQSVPSMLMFLFCLAGVQRFFDTVLGVAVIAFWPGAARSKRPHRGAARR